MTIPIHAENRVLPFPPTADRQLAEAGIARHGLMSLPLPVPLQSRAGAILLAGENLLLRKNWQGQAPRIKQAGCPPEVSGWKPGPP
jgi:hypothetical protein